MMIGTWKGKYKYNLKQNSEFNKKEVGFTVEITEFDGESFIGTIQDDDKNYGTEGLGTIEGKLDGHEITFIKKMPIRSILYGNNKQKVEFENKKHMPIHYHGTLNLKNSYIGKWKIKGGISFRNLLLYVSFGTQGTWEMVKVD